jgi:hypothetical protein
MDQYTAVVRLAGQSRQALEADRFRRFIGDVEVERGKYPQKSTREVVWGEGGVPTAYLSRKEQKFVQSSAMRLLTRHSANRIKEEREAEYQELPAAYGSWSMRLARRCRECGSRRAVGRGRRSWLLASGYPVRRSVPAEACQDAGVSACGTARLHHRALLGCFSEQLNTRTFLAM